MEPTITRHNRQGGKYKGPHRSSAPWLDFGRTVWECSQTSTRRLLRYKSLPCNVTTAITTRLPPQHKHPPASTLLDPHIPTHPPSGPHRAHQFERTRQRGGQAKPSSRALTPALAIPHTRSAPTTVLTAPLPQLLEGPSPDPSPIRPFSSLPPSSPSNSHDSTATKPHALHAPHAHHTLHVLTLDKTRPATISRPLTIAPYCARD